jgi:dTDP-4-dehydrorhamnose 3,5-epimerase/CDP-3, 6-dideoxy-D-glycero-D-glycero-4-hexulose-5-epimerase
MHCIRELLPGARLYSLNIFTDNRGTFTKTFARSLFEAHGVFFDFHEEFYSFSKKDVVRGMHFQLPPHDHAKLIYCPLGAVLDVLVDLRCGPGYGRVASQILSSDEPTLLVIPTGIAHGFKALCDNSLMIYKTSDEHMTSHDAGIRWDSFDFDWGVEHPNISARDAVHPALSDFVTPF